MVIIAGLCPHELGTWQGTGAGAVEVGGESRRESCRDPHLQAQALALLSGVRRLWPVQQSSAEVYLTHIQMRVIKISRDSNDRS